MNLQASRAGGSGSCAVDVNHINNGDTALHTACYKGHMEVVKCLLACTDIQCNMVRLVSNVMLCKVHAYWHLRFEYTKVCFDSTGAGCWVQGAGCRVQRLCRTCACLRNHSMTADLRHVRVCVCVSVSVHVL